MSTFHVELAVGGRVWSIDKGDPASLEFLSDQPLVLDGLTISWGYPSTSVYPEQPEPVMLSFQLLYAETRFARDDGITIGAKVDFELTTHNVADAPTAEFSGRIGALSATADDDGVIYTVVAVDPTAQLGELVVGSTPWPAEQMLARLNRVAAAINAQVGGDALPVPVWFGGDDHGGTPVKARDVDAQPALGVLSGYLRQWPYTDALDAEPHRFVVAGHVSMVPPDLYELVELRDHIQDGRYPGELQDDGSIQWKREPLDPGLGRPWVLDAAWVEFGATWQQSKGGNPNAVAASSDAGTAIADAGERPLVTAKLDGLELTSLDDLARVAQMYLPDTTPAAAWTADSFTLLAYLDDVDLGDSSLIYSGRTSPELAARTLQGVMVIDQIPSERTPVIHYEQGVSSYAGMVTSASLTMKDGLWTIDFQLRPDVPRARATGDTYALSFADIFDTLPALTIGALDPAYTFHTARLLRG